jgi:hypothetical protein
LSTRGILSRSTGGRRKGFSSPSVLFDFGTITVTIPANKTKVSGDNCRCGRLTITERKTGKILWCDDWVNGEGMKGEGSFENGYPLGAGDKFVG